MICSSNGCCCQPQKHFHKNVNDIQNLVKIFLKLEFEDCAARGMTPRKKEFVFII